MLRIKRSYIAWLWWVSALSYSNTLVKPIDSDPDKALTWAAAPVLYYSEYTALTLGVGGVWSGVRQPQETLAAAAFKSNNQSRGIWLFGFGSQLPGQIDGSRRWFINSKLHWGWLRNTDTYRDGNPNFSDEVAGSNASSADNFIRSRGEEGYGRFTFKFLLPTGHGKDQIIHVYKTQNDMLVPGTESGAQSWNPFRSGRSFLYIEPFWQRQHLDDEFETEYDKAANGLRLGLEIQNMDWLHHPTAGYSSKLEYSKDWGWPDSSGPWSKLDFSYSQYISLGRGEFAKQTVLALNLWYASVLSYTKGDIPPEFERPALGGWDRLRAFHFRRYHGRSALYYAAEYRYTPNWNPLPKLPVLNLLPAFQWQWALFAETGRVSSSNSLSTLHQDMQWSVGGGVRFSMLGAILRIDAATSEEESTFYVSTSYPW